MLGFCRVRKFPVLVHSMPILIEHEVLFSVKGGKHNTRPILVSLVTAAKPCSAARAERKGCASAAKN
jgi:hypothetical protein